MKTLVINDQTQDIEYLETIPGFVYLQTQDWEIVIKTDHVGKVGDYFEQPGAHDLKEDELPSDIEASKKRPRDKVPLGLSV